MTPAIDPTFTKSWFDDRLDELFDWIVQDSIEKNGDTDARVEAVAQVLAFFGFADETDPIAVEDAMWTAIFAGRDAALDEQEYL